ncbi:MAG: hypothetical protein AAF743_13325 [Planctomycetota bacterium]
MKKAIQLSVMSLALVGFSTALVGCGAQPGTTVVKFSDSVEGDQLSSAPRDGEYRLYGSRDLEPIATEFLNEGDDLGFKADPDNPDRLIAIAGDKEIKIDPGILSTPRWKLQK